MRVPENSRGKAVCFSAKAGTEGIHSVARKVEANRNEARDLEEATRLIRMFNKPTLHPTRLVRTLHRPSHRLLRNRFPKRVTQARPARGFSTSTNADVRRTDQSQ